MENLLEEENIKEEIKEKEKEKEKRNIAPLEELNKRRELRENKRLQKFNPVIKTPEKINLNPSPVRIETNISAEQLNVFVNIGTSTISSFIKKENLNKEETVSFSTALYEVGKIHGWWKDLKFLPYLALLAAGVDLGIKIKNKPDTQPKKVKEKIVVSEMNKIIPEKKAPVQEKVDVIDQDKLVNLINGR